MDRRQLARHLPTGGVGVEVGVGSGDFAEVLLAENQPRILWLIDCWEHQPGEYEKDAINGPQPLHDKRFVHVKRRFASRAEVCVLRAFSPRAAAIFDPGSLDWVYIDACHLYDCVMADCIAWWEKLKPGGVLCGHDYCSTSWIDVKRAVDDFTQSIGRSLSFLTDDNHPSWGLIK